MRVAGLYSQRNHRESVQSFREIMVKLNGKTSQPQDEVTVKQVFWKQMN
jgi:hypothetical protein